MLKHLLVAGVLCLLLLPAPGLADDEAAQANRLMVEAVRLVQASELEASAEGKYALLKKAHDNFVAIVERHPSTDLAVKLATGQRIGNISLAGVREALDQVRAATPRKAGAPVQAWVLGSGVAAVALLAGGEQALAVGRDGVAALYEVETGTLVRTWRHAGGLSDVDLTRRRWGGASTVAVSPRGRRVLTAGRNGTVQLRSVGTGRIGGNGRTNGRRARSPCRGTGDWPWSGLDVMRSWSTRGSSRSGARGGAAPR